MKHITTLALFITLLLYPVYAKTSFVDCDVVPELERGAEDMLDVEAQTPEWRQEHTDLLVKGLKSKSVPDLIELLAHMNVDASKIALMFVRCSMDNIVKRVHEQKFKVARLMIVVFQKLRVDVFDMIQSYEEFRERITATPDNTLTGMRKLEILDAVLDEMRNSAPDWTSMEEYMKDIDNSYQACDPKVSDCIEIMLDHPLLDTPYHQQCAKECDSYRVQFDGFCHLKCPAPLKRTSTTRCIGYVSEEDALKLGLILQRMGNSLKVGFLQEIVSSDRELMNADQLVYKNCPPDDFYGRE